MEPRFRDTVPPLRGDRRRSGLGRGRTGRAGLALLALAGLLGLLGTAACSQAPQPVSRAAGTKAPGTGAAAPRSSEAEPKSGVPAGAGPPGAAAAGTAAQAAAPTTTTNPSRPAAPAVPAVPATPATPAIATAAPAPAAAAAPSPAKGSAAVDPLSPPGAGTRTATSDPAVVVVDQTESDPDSQLTLAEAAKAERERKVQAGRPRIVIDNKTLHRYAKGGQLTVAEPKKKAASPAPQAVQAAAAAAERDEKYWRGRVLEIRQRWRKAADRIKELEQDVSDWRRRFYAQDDPYVRDGQIKPAWDRALDQLRESRAEAQAAKKELAEVLEQGRVAGALPGWLREGIEQEPKEEKPVDPTQPIETPIYKDPGP
jgi:hypothetical protein